VKDLSPWYVNLNLLCSCFIYSICAFLVSVDGEKVEYLTSSVPDEEDPSVNCELDDHMIQVSVHAYIGWNNV